MFLRKSSQRDGYGSAYYRYRTGRVGLIMLIIFGCGFFYYASIKPILSVRAARNWQERPCKILSSEVETYGRKNSKYRIRIIYSYTVNNQQYQGNRYDFSLDGSPDYSSKARIVSSYPIGATKICYANPNNPDEAVLNCGYQTDYLWESLPLAFILIGVIGLLRISSGKTFEVN